MSRFRVPVAVEHSVSGNGCIQQKLVYHSVHSAFFPPIARVAVEHINVFAHSIGKRCLRRRKIGHLIACITDRNTSRRHRAYQIIHHPADHVEYRLRKPLHVARTIPLIATVEPLILPHRPIKTYAALVLLSRLVLFPRAGQPFSVFHSKPPFNFRSESSCRKAAARRRRMP